MKIERDCHEKAMVFILIYSDEDALNASLPQSTPILVTYDRYVRGRKTLAYVRWLETSVAVRYVNYRYDTVLIQR